MKVGLNFENPRDLDKVSTINFGYYDVDQVVNGEAGLNWYQNMGNETWSIVMDDIKFAGRDLQPPNQPGAKLAHIDSAGMHIQIPLAEF